MTNDNDPKGFEAESGDSDEVIFALTLQRQQSISHDGGSTMSTAPTLDRHTFYTALMLALRGYTEKFDAEGRPFHRAFLKVIERVRETGMPPLEEDISATYDPVFGVVPEAQQMLLEAEQDQLVALLNPSLCTAEFKISEADARDELKSLVGDTAQFDKLGRYFHEQLKELATAS